VSTGSELWKSDGTAAGTTFLKLRDVGGSYNNDFVAYNNIVYFTAVDAANGLELWKSDGSAAGTTLIDIVPGAGHSLPRYLTNINGRLLFSADNGVNGWELWALNSGSSAAPAAPTNLSVTPLRPAGTEIALASIQLSWTDNAANEMGFIIERSPDGTTGWAQAGNTGTNIADFTDVGLAAGTAYFYRVMAQNAAGNSGYSNTAGTSTLSAAASNLQAAFSVTIAPNPMSSSAVLNIKGISSGLSDTQMIVYNSLGAQVRRIDISGDETTFYRKDLQAGLYFFHVTVKSGTLVTGKLLIE
ncbi:MAG: T9SS type A sorting domain-containing protein, partial [Sphingobacteriales bacterium]